ncbi:hypothetical protein GCM10027592_58080 [Spirosoma flavus]
MMVPSYLLDSQIAVCFGGPVTNQCIKNVGMDEFVIHYRAPKLTLRRLGEVANSIPLVGGIKFD